jgi:hypothetical protein
MSAQEIIKEFKKLPPAERARVASFVLEDDESLAGKCSRNGTAFALVEDLCGSLSGPSDLATNPKYLEKLGE